MSQTLDAWIESQLKVSAGAMLRSISPVGLVKERPGFGQRIRAAKGAIVASPVLASYDPDPDYFFHWYRDSAVVIDALRLLYVEGRVGQEALQQVRDFVRFSRALGALDGAELVADASWRGRVAEGFVQYLRSPEDLSAARGDAIPAETRVNPDGTLDISRWNRPQHDGPPLRALALLRWARSASFDAHFEVEMSALIDADLAFSATHCQRASYDIWEEELGLHYYTLRVSAAALSEGADWLSGRGEGARAQICRDQARAVLRQLDGYWLADEGHYRSRVLDTGLRSTKELDIAVILAAIHCDPVEEAHGVFDPRMQATLGRLETLFAGLYAINRPQDPQRGPAMGRYRDDVYYSGGAYYFSTLGAAEFCFRVAAAGGAESAAWRARGDGFLETVRAYTPADGQFSEQFDQGIGAQTSARHLAWSYAAFISCIAARRLSH